MLALSRVSGHNMLCPYKGRAGVLDGDEERAICGDVGVGHARRVEGETGIAGAIEKDETAGGVGALGEKMDGLAGGEHGGVRGAGVRSGGGRIAGGIGDAERGAGGAKEVGGGFGHDDFHDGFAIAGAGDAAGGGIGVAAAADERRIADAAGKFAASAAGGSAGEKRAAGIESDGADGALLVAAMMGGGVFVAAAKLPGGALGVTDEIRGIAESDAVVFGEAFSAFADEHHVRAVFEDGAGEADGIADALKSSDGTGTKSRAVHDDGVAFDAAIEIEMRTEASVENGIVFENEDGGFDGVQSGAAAGKNGPAGCESAAAAGLAGVNGFIRNVPGTAVDDEGRLHREENGKERMDCPERGGAGVSIRVVLLR